ncbi:GNAT family N-acetyltransferase [Pradoshia sp. D12]|uniref:GNAT family N-acetyltransferase n=2 Tax=Bacillales TaxID=1385 RepID=UPI00112D14A3|nr:MULTISPECIES: GNAT family N-acetyltransferase [Bacillaceae]QFK70428.1 GNAT family N-acetyltransferase [Pradoshia sp. D12]TPF72223.1 GNAT family N-acetyltransferase [Bacillus sp. D12]
MMQVVTNELAKWIEEVETDAFYSRLSRIEKIPDNPMGIEIRKFGNAIAFVAQNIPGPAFNKIKGIMDKDIPLLNELIQLYNDKGVQARFEITPAHATSILYSALANLGYLHTDFLTNLYADPQKLLIDGDENSSVSIREFKSNEFDLFAELYIDAFDMPLFLKENIARNNEILYGMPGWKFYLANYKDKPAGIGVLFMGERGAYLAAAGTIPQYRNKGVQGALIQRRIIEAKRNNCKVIVGQASFGGISQNNMGRAGLKIAYTKSVWTHQS